MHTYIHTYIHSYTCVSGFRAKEDGEKQSQHLVKLTDTHKVKHASNKIRK